MITKELVLHKSTEKKIYAHYLGTDNFSKHVKSPFSEDTKGSLKVYANNTFKCYSTGKQGDVFQFVADLKGIDNKTAFGDVLKAINSDMNLCISIERNSSKFEVVHRETAQYHLDYWANFNVSSEVLEHFNVKPVDKFIYFSKSENKEQTFKIYNNVPAFDFIVSGKHKIYIPAIPSKKVKKAFYKNQNNSHVFGLEQLPDRCDKLIICAGEKDALILNAHGFNAISLQSESIIPEPALIRKLRGTSKELYICYDNDKAGQTGALVISKKYNIINVILPYKRNDLADYLPNATPEAFRQLLEKSLFAHSMNTDTYLIEKENMYFKEDSKTKKEIQVSNFILKATALISSINEPRRIVQVITNDFISDPLEFSVESFISKNAFKKALESQGNYYFFGNDSDLMEIKKLAFAECDITREIADLGYDKNSDSYVFSNGLISHNKFYKPDEYGIVFAKDKGLYIPTASLFNNENDKLKDSKKFKYVMNDISLKNWYSLFEEVHGKQSIISFSFLLSALNFDIISNELNCFPLLNLFGAPRSGKSSLAVSILSLFGDPQDAVMLPNATQASISGKLAQFKNSVTWFDEYNNSLQEHIIQTLKGVFDLQGRLRKNFSNDNNTYSSAVNSPVIITGQEAPTDEALLSRCISIQFKKIKYTEEKSNAFNKLRVLENQGLGHLLADLLKYRESVKTKFREYYNLALSLFNKELTARSQEQVNTRLLQSYSILFASLTIASEEGLEIDSEFSKEEHLNIFIDQLIFQKELEEETNELEVFWQVFDTLVAKQQLIENVDYRFDKAKDLLYFKPAVFDNYRQYLFKTTGRWGLHKSTLQTYLKAEDYFISCKTTVRYKVSQFAKESKSSSSYKVCYSMLPISLEKTSMPLSDDIEQ